MRSILLAETGVIDAGADWQAGTGWVIFDANQTSAERLVQVLSQYYPSEITEVTPYTGDATTP